jgi:hypothetical protein
MTVPALADPLDDPAECGGPLYGHFGPHAPHYFGPREGRRCAWCPKCEYVFCLQCGEDRSLLPCCEQEPAVICPRCR